MKKILAIILSFLMIFLTGCSIGPKPEEEKTYFIPLRSPNFFTLNYKELSKKISSGISEIRGDNGNNIRNNYNFEIFFKPNGQIIDFGSTLTVEVFYDKYEHQNALYFIENKYIKSEGKIFCTRDTLKTNKSLIEGIEISAGMKGNVLMNVPKYDKFRFYSYPNFIDWFDNFNFENILKDYVEEEPLFYEFITNDELLSCDIQENPSMDITFLDCSSGEITKLKSKDFIDSDTYLNSYGFFCAILPYYLQDGTIKGYREINFGNYLREDEEEIPFYVAKNIIVILNKDIYHIEDRSF